MSKADSCQCEKEVVVSLSKYSDYIAVETPFIMSHRAGGKEVPENSRMAVEHSANIGVPVVESDVHATKDGVVVLIHDALVDRTTQASGKVKNFTMADLEKIHDFSGSCPMTLEQAINAHPTLRFNIDVKADGAVTPFIRLMQQYRPWNRVCMASFSTRRLQKMRRALPQMQCSLGWTEIVIMFFACILPLSWAKKVMQHVLRRGNIVAVQFPWRFHGFPLGSRRFIKLGHSLGLQMHVWTINDMSIMRKILDYGVDSIITDIPTAALLHLEQWCEQSKK